jgi:hypothetical protein
VTSHRVLQMTGDAFYTLALLLGGGFAFFFARFGT